MKTHDPGVQPAQSRRVDPMAYAFRRLSSLLVVASASLGIAGAILAEAVGAPSDVALVAGLIVFLAGTAVAATMAGRFRRQRASISESDRA